MRGIGFHSVRVKWTVFVESKSYQLLIRILTNQPTVDKSIVLSTVTTVDRGESVDDGS